MTSFSCITLQSCQTDNFVYITTGTNSALDLYFQAELGNVVQVTEPENFPDIYYTVISICESADAVPDSPCKTCFENGITLDLEYVTSTESDVCPVLIAYVLLNCNEQNTVIGDLDDLVQSPSTVLVTSSDLALYVGSVVNISEYPGNCYEVLGPYSGVGFCPCDYYTVTNAFKDCECCTPPPDDPTCCEIPKSTQKPVKIFYRVTDTECEIKDITRFAENYYRLYTSLYHGIKNCCGDLDLDKIWLKHELSSYNKINPTGFCTPPVDIVCPEPCPEP